MAGPAPSDEPAPIHNLPLDWRFARIDDHRLSAGGDYNDGIYRVRDKSHRDQICIEKVIKAEHVLSGAAENEIQFMYGLAHVNIIRYFDSYMTSNTLKCSIFMEYCKFGNLGDLINKYKVRSTFISESFIWYLLGELLNAVGYLQYGVTHVVRGRDDPGPAEPMTWRKGEPNPHYRNFVNAEKNMCSRPSRHSSRQRPFGDQPCRSIGREVLPSSRAERLRPQHLCRVPHPHPHRPPRGAPALLAPRPGRVWVPQRRVDGRGGGAVRLPPGRLVAARHRGARWARA